MLRVNFKIKRITQIITEAEGATFVLVIRSAGQVTQDCTTWFLHGTRWHHISLYSVIAIGDAMWLHGGATF